MPEDVSANGLQDAFRSYFGDEWSDVLDAVDKSFAYNTANNAYFAVHDLHPVQNLTLEQVLEKKGGSRTTNIIVS